MTPEQYAVLLGLVWAVKNRLHEEGTANEADMLQELDDIERVLDAKAIRAQAFATEETFEGIFEAWNLPP